MSWLRQIESTVERQETWVRRELQQVLLCMSPRRFSMLVTTLLEKAGYREIQLLDAPSSAVLWSLAEVEIGFAPVRQLVLVRRREDEITRDEVEVFQEQCRAHQVQFGTILSLSSIGQDAEDAASEATVGSIALVGVAAVLDLLVQHQIGVRKSSVPILHFEPEGLAEVPQPQVKSATPVAAPPPVTEQTYLTPGVHSPDEVIAPAMVRIEPGTFWMGSNKQNAPDNELPRHQVRLTRSFLLATVPVTQAMWVAVMGKNPSHFQGDDHPVEKVSWFDCVRFCNKLSIHEGLTPAYRIGKGETPKVVWSWKADGYRLPTEAEWEYAARAGEAFLYAGSDVLEDVGWFGNLYWNGEVWIEGDPGNSGGRTHPVGQKQPNSWGLYDMSGNVWEWCWDRYGAYDSKSVVDPIGAPKGKSRVDRGGSWFLRPDLAQVTYRNWLDPEGNGVGLGFRLSRSLL